MKIKYINYLVTIILLLVAMIFSIYINLLFKKYEDEIKINNLVDELSHKVNNINTKRSQYLFRTKLLELSNKNLNNEIIDIINIKSEFKSELLIIKKLNDLNNDILNELFFSSKKDFFPRSFILIQKKKVLNNINRMNNLMDKVLDKSSDSLELIIKEIKYKLSFFVSLFILIVIGLFILIRIKVLKSIEVLERNVSRFKNTGKIKKINNFPNNEIGEFMKSFNEVVDLKLNAESKYKKIFKYSNIGICILSKEGLCLSSNDYLSNMLERDVLNIHFREVFKNKLTFKVKKDLIKLYKKEIDTLNFRHILKRENNSDKVLNCSVSSVWKSNKHIDFHILIIKDTTEIYSLKKKEQEQELLLMQQSKLAAMGEMLGSISHQWRQPLNSLGLIFQDIFSAYKHNELSNEYFEDSKKDIINQLKYMSETIDEFRSYLKVEEGSLLEFNSLGTLENIANLFSKQFEKSRINLKLQIEENDTPLILQGNEAYFKQILMTLVSNAKDALLKNKDCNKKEILINLINKDNSILVEVIDNAGGVETEIKTRIFEPYFTTKVTGTGLGLYISKMILEKSFNSKLELRDSNLNNQKGSCFYFSLKKDLH